MPDLAYGGGQYVSYGDNEFMLNVSEIKDHLEYSYFNKEFELNT